MPVTVPHVSPLPIPSRPLSGPPFHARTHSRDNATDYKVERRMGDTEVSYFLPSREWGVNDMYLHLHCSAPPRVFESERVRTVWALLRIRHPLLASKVEMHSYTDVRFVYRPPHSVEDALDDATHALSYTAQTKDELINAFLNGPRLLSQDRLTYLTISCKPQGLLDDSSATVDYDVFLYNTHFLGDGLAVHRLSSEFFKLLSSSSTDRDLLLLLSSEWQNRCGDLPEKDPTLPGSLEERLPVVKGRFRQVASRVDFGRSQDKYIGGHTFPRRSLGPRRITVPVIIVGRSATSAILERCKSKGVTISSSIFALCNVAWAKTCNQKPEMPMMMYSAFSLRPHMEAETARNDFMHIAIGYFNIVLPSFLPRSAKLDAIFWHRARAAQKQTIEAARNPMMVPRIREMARLRASQARAWAKEDDEKAAGTWVPPPPPPKKPVEQLPSSALIGLSFLGNLDSIYDHASFGDLRIHTAIGGPRQRPGGMLLLSYTFAGKLLISVGYDENALDRVVVQSFWKNMLASMKELLVEGGVAGERRTEDALRARL